MITTITEFRLQTPVSREEAQKIFLSTAPKYQNVPGLIRKCYILSQDGTRVGGVYLWKSRADAESMYTDSWRKFVREKYDSDPSVTYFDTPVVVDNLTQEILCDA